MPEYAIGDVQGCFDGLQQLLKTITFNEHEDRLWFAGDLVNRGPRSLDVLRFIKQLPLKPRICLGNHDLHLLSVVLDPKHSKLYDASLEHVIAAPDCLELCTWLRQQSLLQFDPDLNVVMCHAGIAPLWTLEEAQTYAQELETVLQGANCVEFLQQMYGNTPNIWSATLTGMTRLRVICNYFTRMRFCFADGSLDFEHAGPIADAPADLYPWYDTPHRHEINADLVFGHWAALAGACDHPRIHAIDTGYVWGKSLTALRLEDKQRFSVASS